MKTKCSSGLPELGLATRLIKTQFTASPQWQPWFDFVNDRWFRGTQQFSLKVKVIIYCNMTFMHVLVSAMLFAFAINRLETSKAYIGSHQCCYFQIQCSAVNPWINRVWELRLWKIDLPPDRSGNPGARPLSSSTSLARPSSTPASPRFGPSTWG